MCQNYAEGFQSGVQDWWCETAVWQQNPNVHYCRRTRSWAGHKPLIITAPKLCNTFLVCPLLTSYLTHRVLVQFPYHYTLKNGMPGDTYKLPKIKLLESLLIYLIHPIPPIFKSTLISNICTLRSVHKETTFQTHTKKLPKYRLVHSSRPGEFLVSCLTNYYGPYISASRVKKTVIYYPLPKGIALTLTA